MGSGRLTWTVAFFLWLALIASVLLTAPLPTRSPSDFPRRLATQHLANAIQLTDWVISGAAPVLKLAGTNPNYHGLYQAVEQAHPLPRSLLNDSQVKFPDRVDLPPLIDSMVALDKLHDQLKQLEKNDWQHRADDPSHSAAHTALLLAEQLTELDRADETQRRPEGFRLLLTKQLAGASE